MELWCRILQGILSVLTVLGNGSVIVLITTRRRIRKTANCFVLSLAVADFSFGAFYLVLDKLSEVYRKRNDYYSSFSCFEVKTVLGAASITNLCVMTLDRYISIVHPLRYVTFMRPRRVGLLISAAWVMALIRPSLHIKRINAVPSGVGDVLIKIDIALYQVIPGIALLLATIHILLIVRRHSKQRAALEAQLRHNYHLRSPQERKESQTQETTSAKVLLAVVAVFLIYIGLKVSIQLSEQDDGLGYNLFQLFMIMNSAVNPFAYAFFKTDIKREMRICFCCSKTS